MTAVSFEDLVSRIIGSDVKGRLVIAIAGAPGSGKSTLAEKLAQAVNGASPGSAAILPMDGYHYDDMILVPRGLRPRKGAPETFDVAGFAYMLRRLRANLEDEVAVPVFDRDIEIARAGARLISSSVRTLVVEGNYLLLDRAPWSQLSFDISVMIDTPRDVLHGRLLDRWKKHGFSDDEARGKVDGNDMVNVDLVKSISRPADYVISE